MNMNKSKILLGLTGAGIQKASNEHWLVGAGYEFAIWEKSHLNRAAVQTMNLGLTLSHLYTNWCCLT